MHQNLFGNSDGLDVMSISDMRT